MESAELTETVSSCFRKKLAFADPDRKEMEVMQIYMYTKEPDLQQLLFLAFGMIGGVEENGSGVSRCTGQGDAAKSQRRVIVFGRRRSLLPAGNT